MRINPFVRSRPIVIALIALCNCDNKPLKRRRLSGKLICTENTEAVVSDNMLQWCMIWLIFSGFNSVIPSYPQDPNAQQNESNVSLDFWKNQDICSLLSLYFLKEKNGKRKTIYKVKGKFGKGKESQSQAPK